MSPLLAFIAAGGLLLAAAQPGSPGLSTSPAGAYPVVGTAQDRCYRETGEVIACPAPGAFLSGQDAQHPGRKPAYRDLGDGTVSDLVTGLVWARAPSAPMAFADLEAFAHASRLGGHDDWRVPTIRELYSLIDYRGGYTGDPGASRPYIDTSVFA
ncbi:MAG: DUF1566 domain-containing protein, partial [Phenylobacterium sp.]|nr:DUF1566 domain-containing protein [Phenylobacterium sp.]